MPTLDPRATPESTRLAAKALGGATALASLVAALCLGSLGGAHGSADRKWTFIGDGSDPSTLSSSAFEGDPSHWELVREADATGERAFTNRAGSALLAPPVAVTERSATRDVRVATRCKVAASRAAQGCGVVVRYRDKDNYYLARADIASSTVSLAAIVNGVERPLESARVDVHADHWHHLEAEVRGDYLRVALDGETRASARDPALAQAGSVGLWAPADGTAFFDEMTVHDLTPALTHPVDVLPIMLYHKGRQR